MQLDAHRFLHELGANLTAAVAAPPLVALVMAPGAFDTSWVVNVSAAMVMFLAGETTGEAWADLLLGVTSPSGKLPLTLPLKASDTLKPCAKGTSACVYEEGCAIVSSAIVNSEEGCAIVSSAIVSSEEGCVRALLTMALRAMSRHATMAVFTIPAPHST